MLNTGESRYFLISGSYNSLSKSEETICKTSLSSDLQLY